MAGNRKLRVEVDIDVDGSGAVREVKKTEGAFDRLSKSLKVGLAAGAAAAGAALVGLVSVVRSGIAAFQVQEDAVNKLNAALAPLGDSAAGVSESLQAQASALQAVTKFGDEAIISGQALLSSFTKNEDQIKQATKAALDLASATGQDLNSAFLLLAKAAAGETSSLSRYGIILDENVPKSEKFAAALAAINTQFGGQAEAQVNTFSGALTQLSNVWGDLTEAIGAAIGKNEDIIRSLKDLTATLIDVTPRVGAFASAFVQSTLDFAKSIGDIGRGFNNLRTDTGSLGTSFDVLAATVSGLKNKVDQLSVERRILGLLQEWGEASRLTSEANADLAENMAKIDEKLKNNLIENTRKIAEETKKNALATALSAEAYDNQLLALIGIGPLVKDYTETLEDNTTTHRGLLEAFDDLIRQSPKWQRAVQKNEIAVEENTDAIDEEVKSLGEFVAAQEAAAAAVAGTTAALEAQGRRVDIFNEQGQRTGSRLTSEAGGALFPGLSGARYTYTVKRSVPNTIGGVRFI